VKQDRVTKPDEPAAAKPAAKPKSAPAAVSGGTGTLRVNTRPWSRVVVDGRLIGNTPQMNIPLPPGTHTINLVNPEFGISKSLTVQIKSGETVTRVLTLQ
jgi:serine/threonine-protein kinase